MTALMAALALLPVQQDRITNPPSVVKPITLQPIRVTPEMAMVESPVAGVVVFIGPVAGGEVANLVAMKTILGELNGLPNSPALVVQLGDLVSPAPNATGLTAAIKQFTDAAGKMPNYDPGAFLPVPGDEVAKGGVRDGGLADAWSAWSRGRAPAAGFEFDPASLSTAVTRAKIRIVAIDTDTQEQAGRVSLDWLRKQLEAADRDGNVLGTVVVGHRPLIAPQGSDAGVAVGAGDAAHLREVVSALTDSKKVMAYVAGSPNRWEETDVVEGRLRQFIVGNSAAPLDPAWKPSQGSYYGFAVLAAMWGGEVQMVPMVRRPGDKPDVAGATIGRQVVIREPDKRG